MKRKIITWIAILTGLVLTGCSLDDDHYHYHYGNYWLGYGIIEGNASDYTVKLDNGSRLFPVSTFVPSFEIADGKRVLVKYTILDDISSEDNVNYQVQINRLQEILVKSVIDLTEQNADSIGNDPIWLHKIWQGGGFLNTSFSFLGGGTTHFINLVRLDTVPPDSSVFLELRHNSNEDDLSYWIDAKVSFDLSLIQEENKDSVEFTVKIKGLDGQEYTFEDTYIYGIGD